MESDKATTPETTVASLPYSVYYNFRFLTLNYFPKTSEMNGSICKYKCISLLGTGDSFSVENR